MTLSRTTYQDLPDIFNLMNKNKLRVCFYHLVYSGRGSNIANEDLTHAKTRALDSL